MHSTSYGKTRFHYNGGYDGDVTLVTDWNHELKVPFEDLKQFVMEAIRVEVIGKIEDFDLSGFANEAADVGTLLMLQQILDRAKLRPRQPVTDPEFYIQKEFDRLNDVWHVHRGESPDECSEWLATVDTETAADHMMQMLADKNGWVIVSSDGGIDEPLGKT